MRKIVFVDPHLLGPVVGGAEVQLWLLAKAFVGAGWETHYATSTAFPENMHEGVRIHHIVPGNSVSQQYCNLYACLRKIEPHLIYQRGRKLYTALVGRYCAETLTPFLFAASMDLDCVRYKETQRLVKTLGISNSMRRLPFALQQDMSTLRGMRSASCVLTQSKQQQLKMRRNLGIDSIVVNNMHCVPDMQTIRKADPPLILWLANLKRWKRPEFFLQLVHALAEQPFQLVMAGRLVEEERYAGAIKACQENYRNFQYIPQINFQESNDLIGEASVFVNTSLPYEGFPNTFIQSWLRETPTVSMGFDPDSLIARHCIGAVAGDITGVTREVEKIARDPALRASMGKTARAFAKTEFGLDKNFGALENIALKYID